ncbi:Transcriptional repressor NrdR [bioreactor metagenome]|uniref:Transcriptional repressor NrdR n=1 Tax=bioreactor metagenome TaxID=1076179 RepID=A0A644XCB1_9ZZZZ|nr:transcriptional regulator NrdR [Aminivibrio sp.]MDD3514309.1 transcriptional regulator NrdR [Synergistaceae bacterium]NCB15910.1 transcriptional repressor NrdR [Synergistales bacterium]MEA4953497.1 transcriptional regulator NrdR [Aminivibrio sp.]HPF84008.1 transcriptional regulator NrdR [Aminivibrio sp.]HPK06662.1 transcriptional regulator NrdR [Aminivibrio sp.]
MRCPSCGAMETRVIETRTADEGRIVRRRRECPECSNRFTTYEKAEEKRTLRVIKKDGSRETFDRDKIIRGIGRACEKLPVSLEQIEDLASKIEDDLKGEGFGEVPVSEIGRRVMDGLRKVNQVAYVRFASVYREFTDLQSFQHEIARLIGEKEVSRNGEES